MTQRQAPFHALRVTMRPIMRGRERNGELKDDMGRIVIVGSADAYALRHGHGHDKES